MSVAAMKTDALVVRFAAGELRGAIENGVAAFRGVPYAAPPVGALRWPAPQPPATHSDVLDATEFGSPCAQLGPTGAVVGSEDCLTLNVWAPSDGGSGPYPVMFFIHGGSNVTGMSSDPLYDGRKLSEAGPVVIVTINYRLGPFGFLAHPLLTAEDAEHHSSGNYGLLDQLFALQWVQRNIAAFGGDASNVTIFGESAGGRDVLSLVASPLGAGLFHKAIEESGAPLLYAVPLHTSGDGVESAESFGERLAAALGCPEGDGALACLRSATPEQLLRAIPPDETLIDLTQYVYGPNVDGFVLPESITSVLVAHQQNDVPMIIGTNKNETQLFIAAIPLASEAQYEATVALIFGDLAPSVLARYPVSDYASPRAAFEALATDALFLTPARTASRLVAPVQPKTFVYQFLHTLRHFESLGAFHGLQRPFVFGNFVRIPVPPTKKDLKLSKRMQAYWTNFAATGDPNGRGLPEWPAYTNEGDTSVALDAKIKPQVGYRKEYCEFWTGLIGSKLRLAVEAQRPF
jgi:para-nitrobenzyl esterase